MDFNSFDWEPGDIPEQVKKSIRDYGKENALAGAKSAMENLFVGFRLEDDGMRIKVSCLDDLCEESYDFSGIISEMHSEADVSEKLKAEAKAFEKRIKAILEDTGP